MTHRLSPTGCSAYIVAVRKAFVSVGLFACPLLLVCAAPSVARAQVAVSITAIDDTASESPPDVGQFLVTSAEPPSKSVEVRYSLGGTATPDKDYNKLSGKVKLTATDPEALIIIDVPKDDGRFEGDETVVVTLLANDDDDDDKRVVVVGGPATVTIRDSDHAVTIERRSDASEDSLSTGEFRVSLNATNESGAPLSINYSVGGTASPGTDYAPLSGIAVVAERSKSAAIEVIPLDDEMPEDSETVEVTLTGTGHPRASVGDPAMATLTITDNDEAVDDDSGGDSGSGGGGNSEGGADKDGDGLSNDRESEIGTDPDTADTDADGVGDGNEVADGTDPLDWSSFADVDTDLIPDAVEAADDTDPYDPDSYVDADNGGTADYIETVIFANAGLARTNTGDASDDRRDLDGDGLPDRLEIAIASDPSDPGSPTSNGGSDDNGNSVTNAVEAYLATRGMVSIDALSDLDRDGYPDAMEVRVGLNPLRASEKDADQDGVPDLIEAMAGMDIDAATDSDGDGVPDSREFALGSDFLDANFPVANGSMDDDGDGISNAVEHILEVLDITDNVTPETDSDGDGIADAEEIHLGGDPARDEQPVPWIELKQAGIGTIRAVLSDGSPASATAVIGGLQSGSLFYDWRKSDNAILAVSTGGQTSRTLEFAPGTLPAGSYRLVVQVERQLGEYHSPVSVVELPLMVIPDAQPADVADVDGDGIPDSADNADARNGFGNELPARSGKWLQANAGTRLQLGNAARASLTGSARVTSLDIANSGGADGGPAGNAEDGYEYLGGIYDFEVTALPEVGAIVQIVIPQSSPIGEFPAYRKFAPDSGWFDFVEDEKNIIESAPGSSAGCPAPGDDNYRAGLSAGHFCVQLSIEDGGPNDADAALGPNGLIKDPGGVATPEGEVRVGSGSGRTGPTAILVLAVLILLSTLQKRLRERQ